MTAHEALEKVRALASGMPHFCVKEVGDYFTAQHRPDGCFRCQLDAILASAAPQPASDSKTIEAVTIMRFRKMLDRIGIHGYYNEMQKEFGLLGDEPASDSEKRTSVALRNGHSIGNQTAHPAPDAPSAHRWLRMHRMCLCGWKPVPLTVSEEEAFRQWREHAPSSLEALAEKFTAQVWDYPSRLQEWQEVRFAQPPREKIRDWFEAELRTSLSKQVSADAMWNEAVEASLRAAKRGFQSKKDENVKLRVYNRIKDLLRHTRPASEGDKTSGVTDADKGAER